MTAIAGEVADRVFASVKAYVGKAIQTAIGSLGERCERLERRFDSLPQPAKGDRGEPGQRGEPGAAAEIDYTKVWQGVNDLIGHQLAAWPKPENGAAGKDAEVDYDRIGDVIALAVSKEVSKLPAPKDGVNGKDAHPVDYGHIGEIIKAAAINAVATLPKPVDGKSADPEEMRREVARIVAERVAEIPLAKDGAPGQKGDMGERGDKGEPGEKGERGDDGSPGPAGADGSPGRDGDAGPMGAKGDVGEPGMVGRRGEAGLNGKDADPEVIREFVANAVAQIPKAKDGAPGRDGVDGKDADEALIVAKVLESIPAPKDGPPGRDGRDFDPVLLEAAVERAVAGIPRARDGIDGKSVDPADLAAMVTKAMAEIPRPKDGESVHPDTVALMVREMVDKAIAGVRLPQDGEPGRDALDIDIVEEIEQGRSYAVGTFAKHRGGLLKALRHTDPIERGIDAAGWTVVVEGIAAVEGDWIDERTSEIKLQTTGGKLTILRKSWAVPRDCGVWKLKEYKAGDGVSWDGSFWIAQRDTTTLDKPGSGNAFRLAVKKGRDGKDG